MLKEALFNQESVSTHTGQGKKDGGGRSVPGTSCRNSNIQKRALDIKKSNAEKQLHGKVQKI